MSRMQKSKSSVVKSILFFGLPSVTITSGLLTQHFPDIPWLGGAFKILLSGLVGFGTNNLAIRMLFQPYQKTRFGRQGLIPKEKNNLSASLAERVEKDLMHPAILINHFKEKRYLIKAGESLSRHIEENLKDEVFVEKMRRFVLKQYETHSENVLQVVSSFLDGRIKKFLNKNVSQKNLADVLRPCIKDILSKPETVSSIARNILQVIQENMPAIRRMIDEMIAEATENDRWIKNSVKKVVLWAADLNGASITSKIESFLREERSRRSLESEILRILEKFDDFMASEDGQNLMHQVYAGLKKGAGNITHKLLIPHIRTEIDQFLRNKAAVQSAIPRIQAALQQFSRWLNTQLEEHSDRIHKFIGEKILPNLKLKEMIEKHLVKQDVRHLETMIKEVSHSSLDYIEIAGGILGMIAGVFLISISWGSVIVGGIALLCLLDYIFSKKSSR